MTPLVLLGVGMAVVMGGVLALRLHPFLALVLGAAAVGLLTPESGLEAFASGQVEAGKLTADQAARLVGQSVPARIAGEFGATCGKIGIVIAMAAVIGRCLLDSGAARRIVDALLRLFGATRVAVSFLFSGFLLAIPVFFDTVFYLLMPIGRALFARTGRDYLLYVLTIVAGATMAHSLVPPTPGPLFVAAELGVPIGTMMLGGLVVGACSVAFGFAFARRANRRHPLTPRPLDPADRGRAPDPATDDTAAAGPGDAPPTAVALLPIVLPVGLIALGTITASVAGDGDATWRRVVAFLADKNVALTLAALAALAMLAHRLRGDREALRDATAAALASGAVIILITAAGGAFGGVLRQTGIAGAIRDLAPEAGAFVLPVVFLVTALVRTAQGSATVAMITAAPVAKAFLDAGDLGFHPVYLALAIGCGSKPIPWMNDSGFWVITRMAGLRESETLRFVTPMMSLMGVFGLLVTLVLALLFPLV